MNNTYYYLIEGTIVAIVLVIFMIGMVKDAKEGMEKLRKKEADYQLRKKQSAEAPIDHQITH